MKASFWIEKWNSKQIGFHQPKPHEFLLKYFHRLNLSKGERIFLPLCGKTLDIGWLLEQGLQVVGAELSELAVQELFAELGLTPKVKQIDQLLYYQAEGLDVFVGDVFALDVETLGQIAAIYDRAALVALPEAMRRDYSQHLEQITQGAKQLLITFEYDQTLMSGPPFSVPEAEVCAHYKENYHIECLERFMIPGGFKGKLDATEEVWLLLPK